MKLFIACTLLGALTLPPVHAQSTTAAHLTVTGAVAHPLNWSAAELARQPHLTVKATDKQGREHRYSGVALSTIVQAAGAVPEGKLHGKEFMKALKVTAADNYQVFFALAEVDPAFAPRTIILADQCDGKPLQADAGPWQVIVPGEKKPGRWIRQVTSMQVVVLP